MKKALLFLTLLLSSTIFGQAVTTNPSPIEVDQSVTITVHTNSTATDCNHFYNPTKVYMHAGIGDDTNAWEHVIGNWGQDDGVGEMTNMGNGDWSITITPQTYFNLTAAQASSATKMGMVFRNEDGSQEFKDTGCTDFILNVGAFQVTMINPDDTGIILVANGGNTQIIAQNTNGNANYELFINGTSAHTQTNTNFYNGLNITNITENKYCELVITQGSSTISKTFSILVNNTVAQAMPAGMEDGINLDASQTNKATLVLSAPLKDFVYVAGSFNNWQPDNNYAMKQDPTSGKYWVEITGLTPGTNYTYQYWVAEETPLTDSPKLVKTGDPFSTLVLSPFDDPYIPTTSYPNLPAYPTGQKREVTVLKTGQTPYNWQITNFVKPKKEDLIIYEVLIRDFDANRNFQDLIDRIDYFKNLNVNAIELMPVMEFEGNEGWGYNPSFHMALDKFYGTEDKLKEFIDLCHQNNIAVILDVALNHAFGRNPMERMWMIDDDGDGWGAPSSENPYFNQIATHAYGIGYDFNHTSPLTKAYTKRVIKHWIEDFHIDGMRWDLTKGFTQNCTSGDETCTNAYQQDRVDILREYADYSWSLDPNHYVIFEHLGADNEEQQWANYRYNEGKGVLMWGRLNTQYNQLTMGYAANSNFDRMGHTAHGFTGKRLVGYAESHDEERLMYNNLHFGNSSVSSHNVQDLNTALSRMPALGAVTLTIPGPKMIWHFGDLGMENSLNTCTDGTVSTDCRLATKPQPQWVNNWLADSNRNQIYNDWARINELKQTQDVFEGDYAINSGTVTPRIYIWNDAIPASQLKNVVILANFDVNSQNVVPDFPYTGTWYNLMDNSSITISSTSAPITLAPGEFRIYGNQAATMSIADNQLNKIVKIFPNPAENIFSINIPVKSIEVLDITGKVMKKFEGSFEKNKTFDISNLAPSLYLVKISTEKGIAIKKLIIE